MTENWYPSEMDFDIDVCVAAKEAIKRVWKSAYDEVKSVEKTKMLKQKFKELCEPRKNRCNDVRRAPQEVFLNFFFIFIIDLSTNIRK